MALINSIELRSIAGVKNASCLLLLHQPNLLLSPEIVAVQCKPRK